MPRARAIVTVLLVALVGCSGPWAVSPTGTPEGVTAPDTATAAEVGTAVEGGTAPQAGTAPDADNPWGERTLTVAVANDASPWRNVTGLVADALAYWERADDRYGTYQVNYTLRPSASNPDVVVRLVATLEACDAGSSDGGVGYARRLGPGTPPDRPEPVCVRAGYAESTTRTILEHEFGHLLGLGHDDPPQPLMASRRDRLPVPRPGGAVREHAWRDRTLRVYADYDNVYARRERIARDQVNHTLAYFERGAGGTLDRPVTFVRTDDRSRADVVVTFPDRAPCGDTEHDTCGYLRTRPDGEPQLVFTATNVHEDVVGWYFGYWLAYTFDASRAADLPPAFRNASYDERRGPWWR